MAKIIKLTEKDIEALVEKIIKEDYPKRETDRKESGFRKSSFDPYRRESQIMDMFGPYKDDIPPNAIQYLRKNPASVIRTLASIYGNDKILSYLGE